MRYNIYLTVDKKTEAYLTSLREKLAAQIPEISGIAGKMAPHLSLLVFDEADHTMVLNKFDQYALHLCRFSLILDEIDFFSGRYKVLYVRPVITDELINSYLQCKEHFCRSDIVPVYRDLNNWKPHITLAKKLGERDLFKAKKILEKDWEPLKSRIASVELINVLKPLEVMQSKKLISEKPLL